MIKAVFFDFFGVLHPDTLNAWLESKGLERVGKIEEITKQSDLGNLTSDDFFEALADICNTTAETIRSEFQEFEAINEKVVELIARLRNNYTTVLITNSSTAYVREQIVAFELEPLFDHIIISGEIGAIKPQPEIFHKALELAEVGASEAVFVDDRPVNIEGAKRAGLNGIVFKDAKQLKTELANFGLH